MGPASPPNWMKTLSRAGARPALRRALLMDLLVHHNHEKPSDASEFRRGADLNCRGFRLGPELYVRTGSTGDLVAGTRTDRVFDRANSTYLRNSLARRSASPGRQHLDRVVNREAVRFLHYRELFERRGEFIGNDKRAVQDVGVIQVPFVVAVRSVTSANS